MRRCLALFLIKKNRYRTSYYAWKYFELSFKPRTDSNTSGDGISKELQYHVPEVCINAILKEIERSESITGAVALTTASREMEIQQLKEELRLMQEKTGENWDCSLTNRKFWPQIKKTANVEFAKYFS